MTETKTLKFKVKATGVTTDENGQRLGHIEVYGAAFNNVDEGNDRILPGAFTRTIQNSKARAQAREKKYMLKMLWQHKTEEIIGGWYDLSEDTEGLRGKGDIALKTRRGAEFYELAELEMIDEFSIIYDVMPGGAKYDKSGVRELSELRLFSIDPVTFPMNDSPHTIAIKALQQKAITGSTSGKIGPRDEAWDSSKAEKQIWAAVVKDDGSISVSLAKKYFMVMNGDGSKKGDWSYPFWYVGDDPHICVGAVIAIAGAVGGARGADAPDGLKGKVETLYNRINKTYPDDPQLTPKWKDDGKSMNRQQRRQRKTLLEHYNEEMAEDLLEDLQDVYICSLIKAIFDAFTIGDQPEQDVSQALDDFKELMLTKFVAQAVDCDLSQYLEDNGYQYTPGLSRMLNGSDSGSGYGYYGMSRSARTQQKAGRSISAANQGNIDDHVSNVHDLADKATKAMKEAMQHMKAMHTAADDFADTMQGAESPAYGDGEGEADPDQQEGKQIELALARLKTFSVK